MWVIGHRGAAGTHPENTLASIRAAIASGADWVEIDIRLVGQTLVVIHDDHVDRTTSGTGSVYGYSLDELRALDAGNGEAIPLLEEVLDLIDGRIGLNIEIKQTGLIEPLERALVSRLESQANWHGRILVSSFLASPMQALSAKLPDGCLLAALSDGTARETLELALSINAFSLNVSLRELSPDVVRMAKDHGLRVLVYTVNELVDVGRCAELEVDGIFTDFPARAIAFLSG